MTRVFIEAGEKQENLSHGGTDASQRKVWGIFHSPGPKPQSTGSRPGFGAGCSAPPSLQVPGNCCGLVNVQLPVNEPVSQVHKHHRDQLTPPRGKKAAIYLHMWRTGKRPGHAVPRPRPCLPLSLDFTQKPERWTHFCFRPLRS